MKTFRIAVAILSGLWYNQRKKKIGTDALRQMPKIMFCAIAKSGRKEKLRMVHFEMTGTPF